MRIPLAPYADRAQAPVLSTRPYRSPQPLAGVCMNIFNNLGHHHGSRLLRGREVERERWRSDRRHLRWRSNSLSSSWRR